MKKTILVLFLSVALFSSSGISLALNTEAEHYFVEDQEVPLQRSEKHKALKFKPADRAERMNTFKEKVERSGVAKPEETPILEKYGIVLLEIPDGSFSPAVSERMSTILPAEDEATELPVYSIGKTEQILSNEFIVQFKPEVPKSRVEAIIKKNRGTILRKDETVKNRYVVTFSGKTPEEALAVSNSIHQKMALPKDGPLLFSEPNFIRILPQKPKVQPKGEPKDGVPSAPGPSSSVQPSSDGQPNDPFYAEQWALAKVKAEEAWKIHKGTQKIVIAIIDEGVDVEHPDLKGKIVTPYDATDGDDDQQPADKDGHGTACAGIAAAVTDNAIGIAGLGRDVKIMPVRIAISDAAGRWQTTNEIIARGITKAVERKAKILSNSWGGGTPSNAINQAIRDATKKGRILVFAAGNESSSVSYPASLALRQPIIAVSATNEWDEFKTQSSRDGEKWWGSNSGPQVTVSAPGVHMYTTDISAAAGYTSDDYVPTFNGTSSATPLVAGVISLMLSKYPNLSPSQVKKHLQATADDLGQPRFDYQFGYGRVNAFNALNTSPSRRP